MNEFKISLAAARVNAGMTQSDVAREMRLSKQTLVNWENGKTKPSVAALDYLCNLYKVPKDYIFLPEILT